MDVRAPDTPVKIEGVDPDLIRCPISQMIMRHPVLASDGYHYELSNLLKHLQSSNRSPINNKPFTWVTYDTHLKASLDNWYGTNERQDREPNYAHEIPLERLTSLTAPPQPTQVYTRQGSAGRPSLFDTCEGAALCSGAVGLLVPYLLNVFFNGLLSPECFERGTLLCAIECGLIDYLIRRGNNNTHGILTTAWNTGMSLWRGDGPGFFQALLNPERRRAPQSVDLTMRPRAS